eukprot:snap_masked-scaffold_6-processed-gene-13.43-mRNA-1 protein AED:1.00 eAED:1.00 QI:0/-1/0/0/-1/1/1/0/138
MPQIQSNRRNSLLSSLNQLRTLGQQRLPSSQISKKNTNKRRPSLLECLGLPPRASNKKLLENSEETPSLTRSRRSSSVSETLRNMFRRSRTQDELSTLSNSSTDSVLQNCIGRKRSRFPSLESMANVFRSSSSKVQKQ